MLASQVQRWFWHVGWLPSRQLFLSQSRPSLQCSATTATEKYKYLLLMMMMMIMMMK